MDSLNRHCRNELWDMDFVHDQLVTGRKIRILTVSIRFRDSRLPLIRSSTPRAATLLGYSSASALRRFPRKQSVSIRDRKLFYANSICGFAKDGLHQASPDA